MNQSGFILPPLGITFYAALAAGVIIVGLSIALKVQSSRLEATKAEYAGFVAQTKAIGDAQVLKTKETEAKHERIVKEKDNELSLARTRFNDDVKRLRDTNTSRRSVPEAPTNSVKPHLACFDRAELDAAIRSFTGEIGEIAVKGESCTIDLNNAKEWAKSIKEQ